MPPREENRETIDARAQSDIARNSRSPFNDASWYVPTEQLLKDVASFTYYDPLGNLIDLSSSKDTTNTATTFRQALPGVTAIYFRPTPGISVDANSAVNVAATNMWTEVRRKISGSVNNVDSTDMMMYYLAVVDLYAFHAMMCRAYGVMNTYSYVNRYIPRALIEAMGIDFDDLNDHISDFRGFINKIPVKIGPLAIPANFAYTIRHMWMNTNVYKDSPALKAQCYLYVQEGFWRYTNTSDTGTQLEYMPFKPPTTDGLMTFNQIVEYYKALVEVLPTDGDAGNISSYMLNSFGAVQVVGQISSDYAVVPAYVPEVLSQIHNLTTLPGPQKNTQGAQWNVTQEIPEDGVSPYIYFNPEWTTDLTINRPLIHKVFLDQRSDSPTPGDNMVASRLTIIPATRTEDKTASTVTYTYDAMGSECVTRMRIFYYQRTLTGSGLQLANYELFTDTMLTAPAGGPGTSVPTDLIMGSYFDWFPTIYLFSGTAPVPVIVTTFGDKDNYTVLDVKDVFNLHEAALLGEFMLKGTEGEAGTR